MLFRSMTDCGEFMGIQTPTVGFTADDKQEYICDRNYTSLPTSTIVSHEVIEGEDEDSDHRKAITTFRLDTGN